MSFYSFKKKALEVIFYELTEYSTKHFISLHKGAMNRGGRKSPDGSPGPLEGAVGGGGAMGGASDGASRGDTETALGDAQVGLGCSV